MCTCVSHTLGMCCVSLIVMYICMRMRKTWHEAQYACLFCVCVCCVRVHVLCACACVCVCVCVCVCQSCMYMYMYNTSEKNFQNMSTSRYSPMATAAMSGTT